MEYLGKAAEGVARVGETLKMRVFPTDAHGNKQDYHVFAEDGLRVVATVNRLYDAEFALTPFVDASTNPKTVYYEAELVPTEAGAYVVRVEFEGPDGATAEASAGRKEMELLASTASRETSVVSGQGVSRAKTGQTSYFRVELKDAHGNYAGDGSFVDPTDAASLPEHRMTYANGVATPVILEARLVPFDEHWTESVVEATLAYDLYQGVYVGEYVAVQPGRHDLQVLLHGQPVTHGASYLGTEVVVGDADTAQSVAKSLHLEGFDDSFVNVSAVPPPRATRSTSSWRRATRTATRSMPAAPRSSCWRARWRARTTRPRSSGRRRRRASWSPRRRPGPPRRPLFYKIRAHRGRAGPSP